MEEFKNVKKIVKALLTNNRLLADDDKLLCWKVWDIINCDRDIIGCAYLTAINYSDYKSLPSESTITRARRQIESKYEHLRGNTYKERKCIKEPEIRSLMNELKNN